MGQFKTSFLSYGFTQPGCQTNGNRTVAVLQGNTLTDLRYDYDGWHLKIRLDRLYHRSELYTVYIKYISKPGWRNSPPTGEDFISSIRGEIKKISLRRSGPTGKRKIILSGIPPWINRIRGNRMRASNPLCQMLFPGFPS
jgi:hypothetical protein